MDRRAAGACCGVVSPLGPAEPTGSTVRLWSSSTVAGKRKPLRGSVWISWCFSTVSAIALRTAFRRVVSAASETMRPFQTALMRSSLLTTRSLLRIRYSSRSNTCWRDGDYLRPAMQLAPVGVECVLLEEIAQAAHPSDGLRIVEALASVATETISRP